MKNILKLLFTLLLYTFPIISNAQFTIDGSFQTRAILNHGYGNPVVENSPALFGADQRSRIIIGYKNENYITKFVIQDARVWGSEDFYNATGPQRRSYSFGVHEAWAELMFSDFSSVRVGRQEWSYNSSRLLSQRSWWTTMLAYDAVLYKFHNKQTGLFLDMGISYNNDMNTSNGAYINTYPNRLKTINFINLNKKFGNNIDITFNGILSGQQDELLEHTLYMKATEGLIVSYNFGKNKKAGLFVNANAYYQHGTHANKLGGNSEVQAHMFDFQVGFLSNNKKVIFSFGMEKLSGQDLTNTDASYSKINHTFDLLQGGRHKYYGGQMDYFNTTASTNNGGLLDPYFHLSYQFDEKNLLKMDVFLPMVAANIGLNNPSNELGLGLDLTYTRSIFKDVKISFAGSLFNMSDNLKIMKGMLFKDANGNIISDVAGVQYMFYTILSVSPSFFDSSKKRE